MSEGPSGTITFLFTDIAGSTRLWETDPKGMTTSLATHDRIMRQVIEVNGGQVFATGGDSFSAAFPTAMQAVQAAVAGQLGLEGQTWEGPKIKVRMGIHTGVADERDGDYFGPAVTRAARIMSVGHGRQTLLSAAAAHLIRDHLDAATTLHDLGTHSLKDKTARASPEAPEDLEDCRTTIEEGLADEKLSGLTRQGSLMDEVQLLEEVEDWPDSRAEQTRNTEKVLLESWPNKPDRHSLHCVGKWSMTHTPPTRP